MANMIFSLPGVDKKYSYPLDATSVKLRDFIDGMVIQREEMPETMREISEEKNKAKRLRMAAKVPQVVYAHEHIPYMAKIISVFSNLEYDLIVGGYDDYTGMKRSDVETIFRSIVKATTEYKVIEDFKSFEFNGVEYFMPNKFMEGSTVIEYMESSQFQAYYSKLKEGMWGALPFVIAIVAKPEGEIYNKDNTVLRGEAFKDLDLQTAMNVNFFLMRLSRKLKRDSLFFQLARMQEQLRQGLRS